jgi:hypothetical protein
MRGGVKDFAIALYYPSAAVFLVKASMIVGTLGRSSSGINPRPPDIAVSVSQGLISRIKPFLVPRAGAKRASHLFDSPRSPEAKVSVRL